MGSKKQLVNESRKNGMRGIIFDTKISIAFYGRLNTSFSQAHGPRLNASVKATCCYICSHNTKYR